MTGVMPLPAVMNRIFSGGGSGNAKLPEGVASRTMVPDGTAPLTRWLERKPSGMALTAMEMRLFSQLGGEVSEYDRQCQRPSICRPMPMYCPGW